LKFSKCNFPEHEPTCRRFSNTSMIFHQSLTFLLISDPDFSRFLGRIVCTQRIDAAHCYRCRTQRGLCVRHTNALCEKDWTDRNAVWGLTHMGPRNQGWRSKSPVLMDNFGSCPAQWKALGLGSLRCGVCSKMDHSVLNNDCFSQRQRSRLIVVTLYCSPVKNPPHVRRCGLISSKSFDQCCVVAQR